jgi:uncharacterized protein DUF2846
MQSKYYIILLIIGQILFASCSVATGPLFEEMSMEEHTSEAIVYFYRNSFSGGASTFDLRINGGNTFPLKNKGYYLLILDPGTYVFSVFYNSELIADQSFILQKNKKYYIRFRGDVVGYQPALFGSIPITGYNIASVPQNEALEVLKKCRLIEVIEVLGKP